MTSGTVTNGSTTDTAASIGGAYALTVAGSGTVYNYGSITGGSSGYGASLASASLTNYANASITGAYGVEGGATITNYGTIKSSYEGIVTSGTVINCGSIAGGSSGIAIQLGSANSRLVEAAGSTITGAVLGGGGTLELASGTSGGSIAGIGTSLMSFGTVAVDAASTWTFTGTNTVANVVNNGTVAIASGGSLDVSSAVDPSGSGIFQLTGKATFEVAAALGTNEKIQFLAGTTNNELIIDKASSFGTHVGSTSYAGALLENFTAGDMIDLKGIASTGLQFAYSTTSGDLQITGGGALATLMFQNSTLGAGAFHVASDGSGGTLITHS